MYEEFPNTWKLIDTFRMEQERIPDWPEWCLLPKSAWLAILAEEYLLFSYTHLYELIGICNLLLSDDFDYVENNFKE